MIAASYRILNSLGPGTPARDVEGMKDSRTDKHTLKLGSGSLAPQHVCYIQHPGEGQQGLVGGLCVGLQTLVGRRPKLLVFVLTDQSFINIHTQKAERPHITIHIHSGLQPHRVGLRHPGTTRTGWFLLKPLPHTETVPCPFSHISQHFLYHLLHTLTIELESQREA